MSISSIPKDTKKINKNTTERVFFEFEKLGKTYTIPKTHVSEPTTPSIDFENVVVGTGEILNDIKKDGKNRPWVQHKKASSILYEMIYPRALEIDKHCITESAYMALGNCSDYLLFKQYKANNELRLEKAYFCRNRLCPTCNWRKSLKLYSQMQEVSKSLMSEFPTARYLFLTLTVKNVEGSELETTIDAMNKGFKDLVNKGKTKASSKGLKSNLLGYAKALEIKYDSEEFVTKKMYKQSEKYYKKIGLKIGSKNPNFDKYHPHFHVLLMVKGEFFTGKGYIKQSQWSDIWQDCMNLDYCPIVDIRVIKPNKKRLEQGIIIDAEDLKLKDEIAMSSAISETMKYPVKPDSLKLLEFDRLEQKEQERIIKAVALLSKVLFRKRMVTFGGELLKMRKKLKQDDTEDGNLINVTDEPKIEGDFDLVMFKWRVGAYVC